MSGGSFASSGLLAGVGGSACGAVRSPSGQLWLPADHRKDAGVGWWVGYNRAQGAAPQLAGGGRLRLGAAGPRGGAGLAKSLLFRYVDVGSLTCCRTWTDRAAIRKNSQRSGRHCCRSRRGAVVASRV